MTGLVKSGTEVIPLTGAGGWGLGAVLFASPRFSFFCLPSVCQEMLALNSRSTEKLKWLSSGAGIGTWLSD